MSKALRANYSAYKETQRRRAAVRAAAGREIAPLPPVADPIRKATAAASFSLFCRTYFPAAFYLPWSPDHLTVIAKIERSVRTGSQFAHAMPRGSGKTTLTEIAAIWAIFTGCRRFVCPIGATADRAEAMLASILTELESNDLLAADYPEILYPIQCLERIHNRSAGQTYNGQPTRITLTAKRIVLPTIPGSEASGAIIAAAGLTGGEIRGQKHKLPDGQVARPDLAIIDDPQTTESAWSISQSERREALLAGDILGMAGPGQRIAAILCCTIIRPGDMADRILDRDAHPEWQGERTKLIYAFPTATGLWDKYQSIRRESLKNDGDGSQATEFYREHRQKMDAGSRIAWPERHDEHELSALQHAMNLKADRGEAAFFAEYQNEPVTAGDSDDHLDADAIAAKTNGHKPRAVPADAANLTMFIDVHDHLLYFLVVAWTPDFTGYIIDYGAFPDQRRRFFTLRDARTTLRRKFPGTGKEGAIQAGLVVLTEDYLAREWRRDDGAVLQITRCLIDAGYVPDQIFACIRRSGRMASLMPSKGMGIGPAAKPFSEYKRKAGEQYGLHWRIPSVRKTRELPTVLIDTNFWKTFVHDRLAVAHGDPGSLSLYGTSPETHRLLGEHLTAEFRTRTEGRGRVVDVWKARPGAFDNHWLDCLVGNAVAASMLGATLPGMDRQPTTGRRKAVRLSALQGSRR